MSGRCGCRMAVKTTTEYPPSRHLHNFLRVRTPPLPFAHPPRPTQPLPGFCCRAHAATAPPWRTRRTMQLHGAARDLFSVGFSVFPCFFPQRAPTSRTHTPHAPYSPHTVLMARFLLLWHLLTNRLTDMGFKDLTDMHMLTRNNDPTMSP